MPSLRAVLAFAAGAASLLASLAGAAPGMNIPNLDKRTTKFAYGEEKVRGVNLGGWLVMEPWITPSIFSREIFVDEYTFGQTLQRDALSTIKPHWDTWITEADFAKIASKGLNHVRIPIGWWSIVPIPGNPYVVGAYGYLAKALGWAETHGLKVMIDLHGAPGSQNAFDNSGRRDGGVRWGQNQSIQRTLAALAKIRDDHASHPVVSAIELINEPLGTTLGQGLIESFYYQGASALANSNVAITFHEAFLGTPAWNSFGAGMTNLLEDTHHYECFDPTQLVLSGQEHVQSVCNFARNNMTNAAHKVISGEWTGAMTDCAKWLNGLQIGARYDGTYDKDGAGSYYIGSCDGLSEGTVAGLDPSYRTNIAKFIEAQMDAYEEAAGWIFWTWKTESAPEWDFQELSDAGVIPTPVTKRNYAGQCY